MEAAVEEGADAVRALGFGGTVSEERAARDGEKLLDASKAGDLAMVQEQLRENASFNYRGEDQRTPLHVAANAEVAQALLAAGAKVDAKDRNQMKTPLHWTALGGHAEVVQALLAAGAEVEAKDKEGRTPLQLAERWGTSEVVAAIKAWQIQQVAATIWARLRLVYIGCNDPGSPLSTLGANAHGVHLLGLYTLQAMLAEVGSDQKGQPDMIESPHAAWGRMLRIGREQGMITL